MKLTFDNIEDFDDFEQWLKNKSDSHNALEKRYEGLLKHSKELEAENYELQMENRRLEEKVLQVKEEAKRFAKQYRELKNATAENSDE